MKGVPPGVTLSMMLTELIEFYGWAELGKMVRINCFNINPTLNSSLKFLRRTPWAREEVERIFVNYRKNKG